MSNKSDSTAIVNTGNGSELPLRSRLSLADFEASSAHYPAEVRDAANWLFQFKHERCNGSHDLVAATLKRISPTEYPDRGQYIYQVTTGKYFKNSVGKVAVSALNELAERLRAWDIIEQQRGKVPFNEKLSYWVAMRDYIDRKRALGTVCKFGAIEGETGTGKTAGTKYYQLLNNHCLTVRLEAPSKGSLSRFMVKLGSCYNISRSLSTSERLLEIDNNINETRTIIVENVQKLYNPKTGPNQAIFSYLQELQDDTGCTVILTWTPVFRNEVLQGRDSRYFEQFVSRIGGIDDVLSMPRPKKADLLSIADQFEVVDAKNALPVLAEWSRQPGCLRLIYERLQKARLLAGNKELHSEHLALVSTTPLSRGEEDEL